ncbi:MAG: YbdD/YjiX family protein [Magnetococcales bacterium]|nr:YbdD/YjiX family protein [Magnetococcales bacterium]
MTASIRTLWTLLSRTARLMVGIPDYDTYVTRHRQQHPHLPVMSHAEFIDNRQKARYGGNSRQMGRCC